MSELLSKAEIDALLNALEPGSASATLTVGGRRPKTVKEYDFRRPDKFSKDQLRALHMLMENFCRNWGTFLSAKLRSLVYLEIESIDQMTYAEFLQSLSSPTVIALFSLPPLEGLALLEINPTLAFTMIDRLLGGRGTPMKLNRELTEIEEAVTSGIVNDTWRYLRTAFQDFIHFNPKLEQMEYNPTFVQIVPPSDVVLFVSINMKIGDVRNLVVFCFPFLLLEPILGKLSTESFFAMRRDSTQTREGIIRNLEWAELPVVAQLGTAQLSVRDVLDLHEGDVIKLETKTRDPIAVLVTDKPKFFARPGLFGEARAIEITDYLEPALEAADEEY